MENNEYLDQLDQSVENSYSSALTYVFASVLALGVSMYLYAQLFQSLML